MEKAHILAEIKRTAEANGGEPLGVNRFRSETGIRESDWRGVYWASWGQALKEAGYGPNEWVKAYDPQFLLEKYADFTLELGRLPVSAELSIKSRSTPDFPGVKTYQRFGKKADLVAQLAKFCNESEKYRLVSHLCEQYVSQKKADESGAAKDSDVEIGFVYLMKSGKYYKIGHTNALGRREYELAIQLPERASTVHVITTDDPVGIEAYWHRRFEAKRKNGEWFELDVADVTVFKRRKFM